MLFWQAAKVNPSVVRFWCIKLVWTVMHQDWNQKSSDRCCQTIVIKSPKNAIEIKNCMNVEARNPIKDPVAAFKARLWFLESYTSSPIKAPAKAPIRNPNGKGESRPTTNPILVPQIP